MPTRVDKAAEVERALTNVYIILFKEIKKDPDYPDNIAEVKKHFNRKVNDATRAAIALVYTAGVTYVNTKLKTDPYLTTTDITNQQEQTTKAVDAFWSRIQKDATRTIEEESIDPKPALNTAAVLNSIAAFATTATLAQSTLSKTKQIVQPLPLSEQDIEGEIEVGFEIKELKPRLRWNTQSDERVCPICNALDGHEWEQDDPEIQQPPDSSHVNCRCYLELIE